MGWRRCPADRDSDVLRRIVALLVSLAALAERAAPIPLPADALALRRRSGDRRSTRIEHARKLG